MVFLRVGSAASCNLVTLTSICISTSIYQLDVVLVRIERPFTYPFPLEIL